MSVADAVSKFGASVKDKLKSPAISGNPEDQLRAPLEQLVQDMAAVIGLPAGAIVTVGETSLADLQTRPDYAVTRQKALIGFIEVKAPGKGPDPRRFTDKHDKGQWEKLKSLPNLLYTDGTGFSLWRNGELTGEVIRLDGDVETAGAALKAPEMLRAVFQDFFHWEPVPPRNAKQLADITARLCRLLRDEVTEELDKGSPALTNLAQDWRKLLFPNATNSQFADGYAQAVTFGLLIARARDVKLANGLSVVAGQLRKTNSLIGEALRLLTDQAENDETLTTSLRTLVRVLDAVSWSAIAKGDKDAWLYFYEEFLSVYDSDLRKQTGSYYTPPEIVTAMVRFVDEVLRDYTRFGVAGGIASPEVTLADPAVGTGTFLLGVLRRIAQVAREDMGEGAVPGVIRDALKRLIGFELQFGPFAVAQLRLLAEVVQLIDPDNKGIKEAIDLRLHVVDTLASPYEEEEWMPSFLGSLAQSRRKANEIKRAEPIMVVIGNPPYKEKAKGLGGWVEEESDNTKAPAPLKAWIPPPAWKVSAHVKHLRNLYVYFWRWATWKVFGASPAGAALPGHKGVVCYITVAGFLNGPGFEKMRADLRRDADDIWVIDCSPEGHQPEVATRVFQGVQQPVCIVLASRHGKTDPTVPAKVRFRALPEGKRELKFAAIASISLQGGGWQDCPDEWRAPFLPKATGEWGTFPRLEDLFIYNGSGVMPGRTWVIAPDRESLERRWKCLIGERDPAQKEALFHPHIRNNQLGDKHTQKLLREGLPGHEYRNVKVANDELPVITPTRYGFRTFDRQWIIPDNRLLNQPNPTLWGSHSKEQVYLTSLVQHSPTGGPAISFTSLVPDLHHYKGSFGGRAFPLWSDKQAVTPNVPNQLLVDLKNRFGYAVSAADIMAYVAAIAAHPDYVRRFDGDLVQPGLRIPITASADLFEEAVALGRQVIWLHTFGERFVDAAAGRPPGPPRMSSEIGPTIPKGGTIPDTPEDMPDQIDHDAATNRLHVGRGYVERVPRAVWLYEVSGKQVLTQWFSYRRKNRERPIIGERRKPSALGDIQPDRWLPEYTAELLNVLHVLGRLVELEPAQKDLLDRICAGPLLTEETLRAAGALKEKDAAKVTIADPRQASLL